MVNINGTSMAFLVKSRITAREALLDASRALSECRPHGRDYQTAPKGEYEIARARHEERFALIDRIINELGDEAVLIQDQA